MSRLWYIPEYWARSEADQMLREMSDSEPGPLADLLEKTIESYHGDPEFAASVVAELRRRVAAGIRFWSGPQGMAEARADGHESDTADLIDDEIPW